MSVRRQKWAADHKVFGEELVGVYKGVYSGSTPVENGYGDENLRKAASIINNQPESPCKIWIMLTNRTITFLGRETKEIVKSFPLLQVIFMGYLSPEDCKIGANGLPYGIVQFDPYTRLATAYVINLKSGNRVTVPTVIKTQAQKILDLHLKMKNYDQYILRASNDDEKSKTDTKTGELLGRFSGRYVGDVALAESSGIGQSAVHDAIQLLRQQLVQVYASRKKSKRSVDRLGGDPVVLTISSEGINVIDSSSLDIIQTVMLEAVSYTSVAKTDDGEELFCFISEDERLSRTSCRIFAMNNGKARETCLVIGAAFQIAGSETVEENPFRPVSERDILDFPGALSEKMINRTTLTAVKVVGSGQFGKVYLATMKANDREYAQADNCAVKLLRGGANTSTKAEFLREAAIMAELNHANLCSLLGVSIQHRPWLVVLEFVQYGDLREIFHAFRDKNIEIATSERLLLASQIASGMTYLIGKRFCHRDLASRNCLLHQSNQLKISDFGLSRPFDDGEEYYLMREGARLSMKWTCPIAVVDKMFGESSDMWSFGVTVWECFTNCTVPYKSVKNTQIQKRLGEGLRLEQPNTMSGELYEVLLKCWVDKKNRWKFKDVEIVLKRMYTAEVRKSGRPRDVGALLNSDYTEQIRRMTMKATGTSVPETAQAGGDAIREDKTESPQSKQPAVFEELTISTTGSNERVRMQSVSLASRPTSIAAAGAEAPKVIAAEVEIDLTSTANAPVLALPEGGLAVSSSDSDGGESNVHEINVPSADGGRSMSISFSKRPASSGGKGVFLNIDNGESEDSLELKEASISTLPTAGPGQFKTIGLSQSSTIEDVVSWLGTLPADLTKYYNLVRDKKIDGKFVLSSSEIDVLEALGIKSIGHKRIIRQAIEHLKQDGDSKPSEQAIKEFENNAPSPDAESDCDEDDC